MEGMEAKAKWKGGREKGEFVVSVSWVGTL